MANNNPSPNDQNKDSSVFYNILKALKRGRKDIDMSTTQSGRGLITGQVPNKANSPNTIQQKQQDFMDVQSVKIAHDLYSRSVYYDADRISAYQDFRAMDLSPEVSAALDIFRDECLEASTVIPLLNGEKKTVEELFNEKRENFNVYSYNIKKQIVEPAMCEQVVYKGEQDVYQIIFDDDSSIMATSEHLWLLKNSSEYVKTNNLKINDSIEPFYTRISNKDDRIQGYEMILENNGKWEYTHRIVKRNFWPNLKGVCHHINFCKTNNEPSNLKIMNWFDHQKLHASLNSERWNNQDFADKMRSVFSKTNSIDGPYWTNPEWRKNRENKTSETLTEYFSKLTDEQKKERFGSSGEANPMYNNGYKLEGAKNGRYLHDLKHEFTKEELVEAFLQSLNFKDFLGNLNTNNRILYKSGVFKKYGLKKWFDIDILAENISFELLDTICEKYVGTLILERNFDKICKENNLTKSVVEKFIERSSFKNWCNYVNKYKSHEAILKRLKNIVLNTSGRDNLKYSFTYICNKNGLNRKSLEGILSRSEYKNWQNFVQSINHSIKEIKFVGKRKTYDLLNVGEHHNYAVLTSNGTGVFCHNCMTRGEKGEILNIYSQNARVKKVINDLFHNVLNIDYNLGLWTRELLKYGDNFLKLEIDQKLGIYDCRQLPTMEIHREEGWDGNISSARFRWDTSNMFFEEWQVAHFRLLGDGSRMPYGRSILEPARKLWKQLQLAEDALLVYRMVRAPDRRVYYLEVGNLDPDDVVQYMQKMTNTIKKQPVVDQNTGQINFKYNMHPVWKNTPIPLLDGRIITIEELAKEYDAGKENYVYSVQDKTHQIVPGKVEWCGKNYTAEKLIKVWLDDNTWVMTAPEHPFLLRDGSKVRADELKSNDSLMPFYKNEKDIYRDAKRSYYTVYNPNSGKFEFVHRLVAAEVLKEKAEYNTIHHKSFDRYNNNPNELEWVDFHEHRKMHKDGARKRMIVYNKSDKKIKRVSELNKERNSVQHMEWYNHSELHTKHNENRRIKMQAIWNNPEEKEKWSNALKIKFNEKCFNLLTEDIKKRNEFINSELFFKSFLNSELHKELILLNKGTKRPIEKFFNSKGNLRTILRCNGIDNYIEFLRIYNPFLLEDKSKKQSQRTIEMNGKSGIENMKNKPDFEYKNHKVLRIEEVCLNEDVYCMTVVGLNGENDRHNFALYSFNIDGTCSKSGVFVKNSFEEDIFLPIRGDKGSRVETLPGSSNLSDIQDVIYLQNKLFAALKVPKPYLNYAETIPGGSTLSQIDLRFSRTVNGIQEALLLELRRIANIHLYFLGFEDDLDNFDLRLSNPSSQQELLKLETMKARMEVFKEYYSGDAISPVSYTWAMEYILGFSQHEIKQILRQKKIEKKVFAEIEGAAGEYSETGVFYDLDKKFRRPGWSPDNALPTEGEEGEGTSGGGGSSGGFGGGSSLPGLGAGAGGLETGAVGETGLEGEEAGGAAGNEAGTETIAPTGGAPGEEAPTEATAEEAPEELKEVKLLKNNRALNSRTRQLLTSFERNFKRLEDVNEGFNNGYKITGDTESSTIVVNP